MLGRLHIGSVDDCYERVITQGIVSAALENVLRNYRTLLPETPCYQSAVTDANTPTKAITTGSVTQTRGVLRRPHTGQPTLSRYQHALRQHQREQGWEDHLGQTGDQVYDRCRNGQRRAAVPRLQLAIVVRAGLRTCDAGHRPCCLCARRIDTTIRPQTVIVLDSSCARCSMEVQQRLERTASDEPLD